MHIAGIVTQSLVGKFKFNMFNQHIYTLIDQITLHKLYTVYDRKIKPVYLGSNKYQYDYKCITNNFYFNV